MSQQYLVAISANQTVRIVLISAGNLANFTVVGVSDSIAYKPSSNTVARLDIHDTVPPASQDYLITVTSPTPVAFTLQVTLPGTTPPVAETIRFPARQQYRRAQRQPDAGCAQALSSLARSPARRLRILLTSQPAGSANFSLSGVTDGHVYKAASDPQREWSMVIPISQDYLITLFVLGLLDLRARSHACAKSDGGAHTVADGSRRLHHRHDPERRL